MSNQQVNAEGKRKVEAELLKRGAGSVFYHRGRKSILKAANSDRSRTVELRIKTKRKGNWHTTSDEAKQAGNPQNWAEETTFWVFVDMEGDARYWIVPDLWLRNDIYEAHQQYLSKHGGRRPKNDKSNHHSIEESRVEEWQDKWEILGIFH